MTKSFLAVLMLLAFGAFVAVSAKPVDRNMKNISMLAGPCTGSQLWVGQDKDFQGDAAMGGQRGEQFVVKNISKSSCTINGTPGIVLLDRRGRMMGRTIRPKQGKATTIKARGKATFEVGYHSCTGGAGATGMNPRKCRTSAKAQIRFFGIDRVFTVNDKLDGAIEQVEGWGN